MTRLSPFSVRGRRALMVMRDEREISIVRRQLGRLGMTTSEHDPAEPPLPNQTVDVILMDADSISIKSDHAILWKGNVPIIALIGTETPSRLKWLLDLRPVSFLIKPLHSAGLYTALAVGVDSAQRRADGDAHIEKLEKRIRSPRALSPGPLHSIPCCRVA